MANYGAGYWAWVATYSIGTQGLKPWGLARTFLGNWELHLHGGELPHELGGYLGQVGEDLHGALVDGGLVVGDSLLLAERLHQGVHLRGRRSDKINRRI
jgi:hypothetical protein